MVTEFCQEHKLTQDGISVKDELFCLRIFFLHTHTYIHMHKLALKDTFQMLITNVNIYIQTRCEPSGLILATCKSSLPYTYNLMPGRFLNIKA